MARLTGTARIVIFAVVLAVVGVVAAMMLGSGSTSSAMSGMDHGSGDASMSTPSPTSTGDVHGMDMSGMDHGSGDATPSSPAPTSTGDPHGMDMSGMDHGSGDATPSAPAPSGSGDMPGMDHGHGDAPTSSPAPTSSGDMPGMDHGSGDTPGTESGHGDTHGTSPGGTQAGEASPVRPLAPVLSTFGGGTGAVLLAAGLLRRKDRLRNQAKEAARAARRSAK